MRRGRLAHLGPRDAHEAYQFCQLNPEQCAFIAGWIYEGGLSESPRTNRGWLLAERDSGGALTGIVYISDTGIVIPVIESDASLRELVDIGRRNANAIRVVVGPRQPVEQLWRHMSRQGAQARIIRNQVGYVASRSKLPPADLPLETGATRHLDEIVEASAAMAIEEAKDDPQSRNPQLFRDRIHERILRGRDFVYRLDGRLAFKTNVSVLSPLAGQIEGIYTSPEFRGRGLGIRGTRSVTRWVLERAERAFLLVNDDNTTAIKLYKKLGYEPALESQTIFVQ